MKSYSSIRLKAGFLLLVFGLNTGVGFACSLGLNMGFNEGHHHDVAVNKSYIHIHPDGKAHNHKSDDHNKKRNHTEPNNQKNGCCNDGVIKFNELDKNLTSFVQFDQVYFVSFPSSFFDADLFASSQTTISIKHFVRSYHPPIPDIRIAVQSFQI